MLFAFVHARVTGATVGWRPSKSHLDRLVPLEECEEPFPLAPAFVDISRLHVKTKQ